MTTGLHLDCAWQQAYQSSTGCSSTTAPSCSTTETHPPSPLPVDTIMRISFWATGSHNLNRSRYPVTKCRHCGYAGPISTIKARASGGYSDLANTFTKKMVEDGESWERSHVTWEGHSRVGHKLLMELRVWGTEVRKGKQEMTAVQRQWEGTELE